MSANPLGQPLAAHDPVDATDDPALPSPQPPIERRAAKKEVPGQLLGNARLHVVDDGNAAPASRQDCQKRALLDSVYAQVTLPANLPADGKHQERIQPKLAQRESDRHVSQPSRICHAQVAYAGDRHGLAHRERQQVDRVRELTQRSQHATERYRSPPVLVERLRSHHEDSPRFRRGLNWGHGARAVAPLVLTGGLAIVLATGHRSGSFEWLSPGDRKAEDIRSAG